ncbi:Cgr1 family-domain-containing protein [Dichomitus squalens]|uniref:rRNA-processing protein n=1 Tax=Dichomitus squalens TaxID=114155 RepID=A0A4Q9Q7Y7_9APHY|nr:Cgr1 family-domain-containing protein [Dichomitus squalens]
MSQPDESVIALEAPTSPVVPAPTEGEVAGARPLAHSANGRLSGKGWKATKTATVRSHLPDGVKTKKWEDRMEKVKKAQAIKKLQEELKDEKLAEIQRRKEITLERKKAAEERRRLEEEKAKMGALRAARLRRKAGRTKKINH